MDKERFARMVTAKDASLYRVARTLLRSQEDCKDALQEGILRAWERRHTLRNEAAFGAWLTQIVIRECRNIQRRQHKYALGAKAEEGSYDQTPDPDLHRAVDGLPEQLRLPLVLHYVEGYPQKDVADMLRLPLTTVKNRLLKARRLLRLELSDEVEEMEVQQG